MSEGGGQKETKETPSMGGGESGTSGSSGKNNILIVALAAINMVATGAIGFMVWQGKKKEAVEPKIEHIIKGEHETQKKEEGESHSFVGKILPLETFTVNLAGSRGRRILRANIELELSGDNVQLEIDQRKAHIRDIIIILLSSKSYEQIATKEGKDQLRSEIKDTINAFLTKGKILNTYFTDLIYN